MKRLAAVFVGTALICAATVAMAAGAYKWVDADGKVHYSDEPPPDGARMVEETNVPVRPSKNAGPDVARIAAANPVTLYVISDCQTCDLARQYLKRRGVPFTETNVENNPEAQAAMKERVGALAVPTIIVGEKVMKGYVESLLGGELDAAGYPKEPVEGETASAQANEAGESAEGAPVEGSSAEPVPSDAEAASEAAAPPQQDGQGN
jgi:glutaredoxin